MIKVDDFLKPQNVKNLITIRKDNSCRTLKHTLSSTFSNGRQTEGNQDAVA